MYSRNRYDSQHVISVHSDKYQAPHTPILKQATIRPSCQRAPEKAAWNRNEKNAKK